MSEEECDTCQHRVRGQAGATAKPKGSRTALPLTRQVVGAATGKPRATTQQEEHAALHHRLLQAEEEEERASAKLVRGSTDARRTTATSSGSSCEAAIQQTTSRRGESAPSPYNRQSFFVGVLLPGLNEMIAAAKSRKGNWSAYAEMKALYGSLAKADIRAAKLRPMRRVRITCLWHEKNQRRDPDNIAAGEKFILDALVAQGILPNDGRKAIVFIGHAYTVAPEKPGCLVTLTEVP